MKKWIIWPLILVLVGISGFAFADTSVMRTDTSFSMSIDNLNTAESHVMALRSGDELYISSVITAGKLSVVIKKDNGETLYSASDASEPGFTLTIPSDGHYRISVTGDGASGNLWISVKENIPAQDENAMPARRVRVQSLLGYTLECDADYFAYTAATALTGADVYQCQSAAETRPEAISFTVAIEKKSLTDAAAEYVADESVEELAPAVIDFRAARTFHRATENGDSPDILRDVTLIECGEAEVLVATATYYDGAQDAAAKVQRMIDTLQFTR